MKTLLLLPFLLAPLAAQDPGLILPRAFATTFAASSTNRPFAAAPTRHQQLFPAGELPVQLALRGLMLRKDDRINSYSGTVIDLEIRLAHTTRDEQTLSPTFDANFDAGTPVTVFARRQFPLASMPWNQPASPDEFFLEIPFDREFTFQRGSGNLLLDVRVHGNAANNQSLLYPLDAGAAAGSCSVYANGASAASGVKSSTVLAVRWLTPADRKAAWSESWPSAGPTGRSDTRLAGGNPPLLGGLATMDVFANGWDFAFVLVAFGVDHGQSLPMPGYALPVYPALQSMLGAVPLSLQGGYGMLQLPLPNDRNLLGADVAFQAITSASAVPLALGGSNLLLANLGDSLFGSAVFAMVHSAHGIAANSWFQQGGQPVDIHVAAGDRPDKVQVQGIKSAGVGPLHIVVTDPNTVVVIPVTQTDFSVTVTVNPGGRVRLFNADTMQSMNVDYEVTVVD